MKKDKKTFVSKPKTVSSSDPTVQEFRRGCQEVSRPLTLRQAAYQAYCWGEFCRRGGIP